MLEPVDWRHEARLLRAAGWTPRRIAKMLGRSLATVEEALRAPREPKPQAPKPIKAAGDRKPQKPSSPELAGDGAKPLGAGRAKLTAQDVARTPRVVWIGLGCRQRPWRSLLARSTGSN